MTDRRRDEMKCRLLPIFDPPETWPFACLPRPRIWYIHGISILRFRYRSGEENARKENRNLTECEKFGKTFPEVFLGFFVVVVVVFFFFCFFSSKWTDHKHFTHGTTVCVFMLMLFFSNYRQKNIPQPKKTVSSSETKKNMISWWKCKTRDLATNAKYSVHRRQGGGRHPWGGTSQRGADTSVGGLTFLAGERWQVRGGGISVGEASDW